MGGDPWHAVCGEAVFAHLPGWQIAYPSTVPDAVGLLRTALRGDNPVMFLEHRLLYRLREANAPYPGPDYQLPFGRARRVRAGRHTLILTWGEPVYRALEAAGILAAKGIETEILDLRTLVPWDEEAVFEAVRRIGKVLIVHEDNLTCGFGAELAAQISRHAFSDLDGPIYRVAMADVPPPSHKHLFDAIMPTTQRVLAALEELVAW
jgi:2-oxoisovalerate dehydrogenase E1 component